MKKFFALLSLVVVTFSCSSGTSDSIDLSLMENLKSKEAKVEILIDKQLFYPEESIFLTQLSAGEKYISINLSDQFGGNLQIQLAKPGWLADKNQSIRISNDLSDGYENYGSFLIGKRKENSLEGYILSRGEFKWLILSKEKAVLSCRGFVISPQNAAIPENEIPFEGNIYFKEPQFELIDIKEESLF